MLAETRKDLDEERIISINLRKETKELRLRIDDLKVRIYFDYFFFFFFFKTNKKIKTLFLGTNCG